MLYSEERGDLFTVPPEYVLAHCISVDCKMGAGIAVAFRKNYGDIQGYCEQQHPLVGQAVLFRHRKHDVFNLITKRVYHGKPTYQTLGAALEDMRRQVVEHGYRKIAMPRIASGLDRLSWAVVREMVKQKFDGLDVEVLVKTG